jgi:predicted MFS family arabinose efflux permease
VEVDRPQSSPVVEAGGTAATPQLSLPIQRRVLAAGVASWTLMAVGTLGLTPVYPDIARSLELKTDSFGAILGIATLVAGVLQVPMGLLADRYPVKYLGVAGLLAAGAAPAIWSLSPTYQVYALGQVAMGISIVCLQASFHTALAITFPGSGRNTAMSMLFVGSSLGSVISLVLFGQLGDHLGWRAVALGICWLPLAALPLTLAIPNLRPIGARRTLAQIGHDSARYLLHGRAAALFGLMSLIAGSAYATQFVIPFVLRGHAYGAGTTGLLLMPYILGGLIGSLLLGALADHLGPTRPLAIGATGGALALVALAVVGPHPLLLIGCFFVLGTLANGGQAVLLSAAAQLASQRPGVGAGSALGVIRLAQSLGPAVSPTIIGIVFLASGGGAAELTLATAFALAAALAAPILGRPRPKSRRAERAP